ncbi:MAG: hypothetical protein M3Q37_07455, partial [Gemmatimonadota bacterium]|nr:hypothetical protein [Gemmatimonadota bacterium]
VGAAWFDAGVRAGLLPERAVGAGAFASLRWARDGYRIGVWLDAGAASEFNATYDERTLIVQRAVTAGLLLESF